MISIVDYIVKASLGLRTALYACDLRSNLASAACRWATPGSDHKRSQKAVEQYWCEAA
jgi:hypothetical protein